MGVYRILAAVFGTYKVTLGSGFRRSDRGRERSRGCAGRKQAVISTAPAATSMWPFEPLGGNHGEFASPDSRRRFDSLGFAHIAAVWRLTWAFECGDGRWFQADSAQRHLHAPRAP